MNLAHNYSYPLDLSWSLAEIETVIAFFNQVEIYYEGLVNRKLKIAEADRFLVAYKSFKEIVPSKAQEKRLMHDFEKLSGYSCYKALQAVKSQLAN